MEIQVLKRGLKLLELAADEPDRIFSVSDFAEASGMKNTTCYHIINTLVTMGYLETQGKRKGYRIGPAVNHFSSQSVYRHELTEQAKPMLEKFATELGETILLAVTRNGTRYILIKEEGRNTIQVKPDLILQDIYGNATGRLLLAHTTPEDLESAIKALGLPTIWKEAETREDLERSLAEIRQKSCMIIERTDFYQIAVPVWDSSNTPAALGTFVPSYRFNGNHREEILQELKNIAKELSK